MLSDNLLDSLKPILVSAFVISLYTLISNFIFGHQTFWKPSRVLSTIKKVVSSSSLPQNASVIVIAKKLELLNDDSLCHCLGYLNAAELHRVSKVAKRFQLLSNYPVLWSNLLDNAFFNSRPEMKSVVSAQFPVLVNRKELFYHLRTAFCTLLVNQLRLKRSAEETEPFKSLYVILRGDVLELSVFAEEHPGGEHILRHVDCTDATNLFELANHSDLAIELSKNFIIWSGKSVFGS